MTADTARALRRTIAAALLGCVAITVLMACSGTVAKPISAAPTAAAPTAPPAQEPTTPTEPATPPAQSNVCVPNLKIHSSAATGGAIQGAIKDEVLYWGGTQSDVECLPEAQQNQKQLNRVGNTHEGTPTYRVIRVHRPIGARYYMLMYLSGRPVCIIDVTGACDRMLSALGNYNVENLPAEAPALDGSTTPPTIPSGGGTAGDNGPGSGATATASIGQGRGATATVSSMSSRAGSGATATVSSMSSSAGSGATALASMSSRSAGSGATADVSSISRGGSGATATASIGSGSVTGVTITNGGSGYISPPIVVFSGGDSHASGTATISGGSVTGVTITSAGNGRYRSAPRGVVLFHRLRYWRDDHKRRQRLLGAAGSVVFAARGRRRHARRRGCQRIRWRGD